MGEVSDRIVTVAIRGCAKVEHLGLSGFMDLEGWRWVWRFAIVRFQAGRLQYEIEAHPLNP